MKPYQLKKLIREVIHEIDGMSAGKPTKEPEIDDDGTKFATKFEKERRGTVVKLKVNGLKDSQIKKILGKLSWQAKKNDLDVIHAEIERDGRKVASMDASELQAKAKEEEPSDETPSGETPEDRLAKIQQGEKEPEWKAATEKDLVTAREKAKLRAAKLAAGTLKLDPETGFPADTSLWTDEEWKAWEKKNPPKRGTVGKLTLKH